MDDGTMDDAWAPKLNASAKICGSICENLRETNGGTMGDGTTRGRPSSTPLRKSAGQSVKICGKLTVER